MCFYSGLEIGSYCCRCARIYSMTFSADSLFLACSSNTETVHVFKLEDHKEKYVYWGSHTFSCYPSPTFLMLHPLSHSLIDLTSLYRRPSLLEFFLTWHGHVERKDDADYPKACTRLVVEEKAPVGRSRKSWQNTLSADMHLA